MKKNISIRLMLVIFSVILTTVLLTSSAMAWFDTFEEMYMVDAVDSTVQQDIFQLDEIPYLYLKLPEPAFLNFTITWWWSPSGDDYHTFDFSSGDQELWISLENGYSWMDIVEVGDWGVTAAFAGTAGLGIGQTVFSVVPEPVSSTLFLVGAASLGARRFWKKRKAA